MTTLAVGCPVRDRAWAIPFWFEHLLNALGPAEIDRSDVTAVFVGDYSEDGTFRVIEENCLKYSINLLVMDRPGTGGTYVRDWKMSRYEQMAELRNALLDGVQSIGPDLFWSLDSDILVADQTLASAIDALDAFDAVGSRCYLSNKGTWCPNYANLSSTGSLLREDSDALKKVGVLMAAKLMTPQAYQIRYVGHRQGEDIGWSLNARKAGLVLGWDGRTISKHVFTPSRINEIDPRCGF